MLNENQRTLGFWESTCKLVHDFFCGTGNVAAITTLEGTLNASLLMQAIEYCFQRHPLLQAILRNGREGVFFDRQAKFSHIDIQFLSQSKEEWRNTLNTSINQSFCEDQSLWRLLLLSEGEQHQLIIISHHAICDALSLVNLTDNILCFYENLSTALPINIKALPLQQNIEKLLSETNDWPQYLQNNQDFAAETMAAMPFQQWAPLNQRYTQTLSQHYTTTEFQQIITACKQHHVSVNALLNSVTLLTYAHFSENNIAATLNTPVNLRGFCVPPLSLEHVGCNVSMVRTRHSHVSRDESIWSLARVYQQQLQANIPRLGFLPREFDHREFDISSVMNLFGMTGAKNRQHFLDHFGVSNIGIINLKPSYVNLKCSAFTFCTNRNAGDFGLFLHVTSLHQQMYITFSFAEPLLSLEWVTAFSQKFRELFYRACNLTA